MNSNRSDSLAYSEKRIVISRFLALYLDKTTKKYLTTELDLMECAIGILRFPIKFQICIVWNFLATPEI